MSNIEVLNGGIAEKTSLISDKFAIDLVNSIEVQDDLIRFKPNNSTFFKRAYNNLTGKNIRNQDSFNSSVTDGLKAASDGLMALQKCQVESDRAISLVANKLIETREGVMKLNQKLKGLNSELSLLSGHLDKLDKRFENKLEILDYRVSYLESKASIDIKAEDIRRGKWSEFPLLIQLHIVLSEMKMGVFGVYIENKASNLQALELIDYLKSKFLDALPNENQRLSFHDLFNCEQQIQNKISLEQLSYTLLPYKSNERVLGFLSNQLDQAPCLVDLGLLPTRMSQKRLNESVISELFGCINE